MRMTGVKKTKKKMRRKILLLLPTRLLGKCSVRNLINKQSSIEPFYSVGFLSFFKFLSIHEFVLISSSKLDLRFSINCDDVMNKRNYLIKFFTYINRFFKKFYFCHCCEM